METIRACAVFILNIATADQRHLSAYEKAACIASAIRLLDTICPDGNYGCHHGYIASLEMLHSLYLRLENPKGATFAALDIARENGLKCIQVCEDGVAHYTASLVRLAEEKPDCHNQYPVGQTRHIEHGEMRNSALKTHI